MSPTPHVFLPMLGILLAGLAGCLGGSPETCVPTHGDGEGEPMTILTDPQGPDGEPGWQILVQCNEAQSPLAAYRFRLDTGDGRNITVEPVGTWNSPATYYAATNGTDPGDEIQATTENPGNGGDPTYRFRFLDEDANGVVAADDRIEIDYDAGAVGTTTFPSEFPGGLYRLSVFEKEGGNHVAEVLKDFPDPRIS